jgi:hypothetical protein
MAEPGIGTRGESIDLLTALDLLGKAEARVAELEAERERLIGLLYGGSTGDKLRMIDRELAALAAVRQEGT